MTMTFCRRCGAAKKTDLGPFCLPCAQHFNAIKRGHHHFASVRRPPQHARNRRNAITLPTVSLYAGEQGR
jgi:hypothetical protein